MIYIEYGGKEDPCRRSFVEMFIIVCYNQFDK